MLVLTGVGDLSPPAQAVQSNGGALGEAVGPQGNSPKIFVGPQGDSCSVLHEGKIGGVGELKSSLVSQQRPTRSYLSEADALKMTYNALMR